MDNMNLFNFYKKGSKILIKKLNRGKFTEYCGGKVTNECILKAKRSGNKTLVKRAVFAENARKWKQGGIIRFLPGGALGSAIQVLGNNSNTGESNKDSGTSWEILAKGAVNGALNGIQAGQLLLALNDLQNKASEMQSQLNSSVSLIQAKINKAISEGRSSEEIKRLLEELTETNRQVTQLSNMINTKLNNIKDLERTKSIMSGLLNAGKSLNRMFDLISQNKLAQETAKTDSLNNLMITSGNKMGLDASGKLKEGFTKMPNGVITFTNGAFAAPPTSDEGDVIMTTDANGNKQFNLNK